ncbi:MAG: hypothetical protein Q8L55_12470, partial [Phycisphaerales bacterium]|nr:hypothetical protein [Phycisphaerales bacterium]
MNKGIARFFAPLAVVASLTGASYAGDGNPPPNDHPPGHPSVTPAMIVHRAVTESRSIADASCAAMNAAASEGAQRIIALRRHNAPVTMIAAAREAAIGRINHLAAAAAGRLGQLRTSALARLAQTDGATPAHRGAINSAVEAALHRVNTCR